VDLAADLGAKSVVCTHLVLFDHILEEEILSNWPQLSNQYIDLALERALARGVELIAPQPFPTEARTTHVEEEPPKESEGVEPAGPYRGEKCYFLWQRVYLGPNGEVVPCCLSGMEAFGYLTRDPFLQIWNGSKYQAFRRQVHTSRPMPPCEGCYLINRNPGTGEFKKVE